MAKPLERWAVEYECGKVRGYTSKQAAKNHAVLDDGRLFKFREVSDVAKAEISVELIIHQAMNELAENVYRQHGVRIETVDFNWEEYQRTGTNRDYLLQDTSIHTKIG